MRRRATSLAALMILTALAASSAWAQDAETPGKAERLGKQLGQGVDNIINRFNFEKAFQDVRGDIKSLRKEVLDGVRKFRDVEARTLLISTGSAAENPLPAAAGQFVGCEDTREWAKQQCGKAKIVLKEHFRKDGSQCPVSIATVTCLTE
ncbi:MAG: hypothetical protein AB7F96_19095 [Beijerinckiaceae bacterium]